MEITSAFLWYKSLFIHYFAQFSQQSYEAGKTAFILILLGEAKAQRDYVTCPKPHMQLMVVGFEARSSNSRSEGQHDNKGADRPGFESWSHHL